MDRLTFDFNTPNGKCYLIARGFLREQCMEKLGIIEDMIGSGEIPKEIADKIDKKIKGRFGNADL